MGRPMAHLPPGRDGGSHSSTACQNGGGGQERGCTHSRFPTPSSAWRPSCACQSRLISGNLPWAVPPASATRHRSHFTSALALTQPPQAALRAPQSPKYTAKLDVTPKSRAYGLVCVHISKKSAPVPLFSILFYHALKNRRNSQITLLLFDPRCLRI